MKLVIDLSKIRSNLKKLYRHLDNILNMRFGKSQPISLVIDLTGKCDWNCKFCYIKNRDKTIELDYKKLINFIDVVKPLSVELTGGEPCLYSKINELVLYLFSRRIKIGFFTNGQQFWRLHYPNVLSWVRVSINKYIDENKEFTDPPYPKKIGYSYIVHENSPHDWKDRISKFDYGRLSSPQRWNLQRRK
jgi:MoaA/NifB/PqqE/SkfB family radical SAM enzyme